MLNHNTGRFLNFFAIEEINLGDVLVSLESLTQVIVKYDVQGKNYYVESKDKGVWISSLDNYLYNWKYIKRVDKNMVANIKRHFHSSKITD